MSAAPILYTTPSDPPKLLLDANVFRALANEHSLDQHKDRLLKIATCRKPPVLWACPTTFTELAGHVRVAQAHRFDEIREALLWMEHLCCNEGMAEQVYWILVRAICLAPQPHDRVEAVTVNRMRRAIIKARTLADVPQKILTAIEEERTRHITTVSGWSGFFAKAAADARRSKLPRAKLPATRKSLTNMTLKIARDRAAARGIAPDELKAEPDQAHELRELIAFETARVMKGANDPKYNVESHFGDFNDFWLCAYPAAGYTLVTQDRNIRKACIEGGCKDPRVVDVPEAIAIAENYLNSRSGR